MECNFSILHRPTEYETQGLCDGLPIRKHVAPHAEEIGSFRAQEDWNRLVSPISNFNGGLGPIHSFMAVSLPECLPERFEVVSYANEFAFLHDGMMIYVISFVHPTWYRAIVQPDLVGQAPLGTRKDAPISRLRTLTVCRSDRYFDEARGRYWSQNL
jgi:hypothetical protein